MSPPHCHYGSSDNGTPTFGNTSFSIASVPRHYIFKPRGAGTELLLALWDRCQCLVVILVIASCQWICCAVWLHFHSVQHYKYIGAVVHCAAENSPSNICIYSVIVHHAAWLNIVMELCTVCPLYMCPVAFLPLCISLVSLQQCHISAFPYIAVSGPERAA